MRRRIVEYQRDLQLN